MSWPYFFLCIIVVYIEHDLDVHQRKDCFRSYSLNGCRLKLFIYTENQQQATTIFISCFHYVTYLYIIGKRAFTNTSLFEDSKPNSCHGNSKCMWWSYFFLCMIFVCIEHDPEVHQSRESFRALLKCMLKRLSSEIILYALKQ